MLQRPPPKGVAACFLPKLTNIKTYYMEFFYYFCIFMKWIIILDKRL